MAAEFQNTVADAQDDFVGEVTVGPHHVPGGEIRGKGFGGSAKFSTKLKAQQ
jgi:hypothetical protein